MKTNIYPPPIYRLDKLNHYIKAKLDNYLRESKKLSKGAFDKVVFMQMFFENELEQAKILLGEVGIKNSIHKDDPYSMSFDRQIYGYTNDRELNNIEKEFFKFYIISLEKHLKVLAKSLEIKEVQAAQIVEIKKEEVPTILQSNDKKEMHNRIFIGNSFEVWERMFEKFRIKKNKRTDVNFMFEVMKYNKQIHKNIGYVDIQEWINEVYEICFEKIVFTDHKTKANEKRLIIYNQIIS